MFTAKSKHWQSIHVFAGLSTPNNKHGECSWTLQLANYSLRDKRRHFFETTNERSRLYMCKIEGSDARVCIAHSFTPRFALIEHPRRRLSTNHGACWCIWIDDQHTHSIQDVSQYQLTHVIERNEADRGLLWASATSIHICFRSCRSCQLPDRFSKLYNARLLRLVRWCGLHILGECLVNHI